MDKVTREEALRHVSALLSYIGEDANRAGLKETPDRFLRAWESSWGKGYNEKVDVHVKLFPNEGYQELICIKDIPFFSHCEHHIAPFFGTAHVLYRPNNSILGLSKFSRIIDNIARRLQTQERLTKEVCSFLFSRIAPKGLGVLFEATHLCVTSRGAHSIGARTTTCSTLGDIDYAMISTMIGEAK